MKFEIKSKSIFAEFPVFTKLLYIKLMQYFSLFEVCNKTEILQVFCNKYKYINLGINRLNSYMSEFFQCDLKYDFKSKRICY